MAYSNVYPEGIARSGLTSTTCSTISWSPKYRKKVLNDEVTNPLALLIEEKATELDLEIIELAIQPDHVYLPPSVGVPILGFGLFVIALGLYIHFVAAPEPPTMREGEERIDARNLAQRAGLANVIVGFLTLTMAAYLLIFTFESYVYPTLVFVVGLYVVTTGLHTYWPNTLTTYYVTNQRLIKEYRFISLVRQEIPFGKVRGIQERKSIWEALVGLGNGSVASGGGSSLEVVIRNIYSPTEFADEIRNLV